ncbi:hypothetical protein RB195_015588 [Necator americanus]
MLRLILLLAIVSKTTAQMVRQCTCQQVEPCSHVTSETVLRCIDQCQRHAAEAGLSYPTVRQCFNQVRGSVDSLISCYKTSVFDKACAMGPPAMVPKRYMETFKLALFNDMNAVLTRSGVRNQVMSFARAGKKFTSCNMNCVQRVTSECRRRHNCGLSLPSDNIMIQTLKQCMQISGFHTTGVQQICSCLATAGARQLAPICNRIIISK